MLRVEVTLGGMRWEAGRGRGWRWGWERGGGLLMLLLSVGGVLSLGAWGLVLDRLMKGVGEEGDMGRGGNWSV